MRLVLPILILIVAVLGCANRGSRSEAKRQATNMASSSSSEVSLEKRRTLANGLDGTGGYDVKLDGGNEDILVITHFMLSKAKAREFIDETSGSVPYEKVGFREVLFQQSPKPKSKRWVYNFATGKLSP